MRERVPYAQGPPRDQDPACAIGDPDIQHQQRTKVRIDDINFFGNQAINEARLKKQLKDTKERSRFTIYPPPADSTTVRIPLDL